MTDSARPLGRRPPTDDRHLQRYSLTPGTVPDKPTPVVLGIWWYAAFDTPTELTVNGRKQYWIGLGDNWGGIRGGHAICVKPDALVDTGGWWSFYDQGREGACVGFAASRMMSLLNRKRYDARWLYHEAQEIDEWPGEDYDGTSVRAGMDVLRLSGHRRKLGPFTLSTNPDHGIVENRWATNVDDVLACLHNLPERGDIVLLNSWGKLHGKDGYAHHVHLPLEALDRLLRENGEATVVVDKP